MKQVTLAILAIGLLFNACRDYDLILGRSVYEPHRPPSMYRWGKSVAYYLEEGQELTYQGAYAVDPYLETGLVRRFDRREGWSYVTIEGTLPVDEGTLVEVRGTVITLEIPITGTGRTSRTNRLHIDDHLILLDTASLRERARREYARIRGDLQEKIALPGSKLILAADPQWRVDWIRGEDAVVVAAHSFDLMYAAEAEFLFSQTEGALQTVYFQEWFKGE
jgi:hypothetical protein